MLVFVSLIYHMSKYHSPSKRVGILFWARGYKQKKKTIHTWTQGWKWCWQNKKATHIILVPVPIHNLDFAVGYPNLISWFVLLTLYNCIAVTPQHGIFCHPQKVGLIDWFMDILFDHSKFVKKYDKPYNGYMFMG